MHFGQRVCIARIWPGAARFPARYQTDPLPSLLESITVRDPAAVRIRAEIRGAARTIMRTPISLASSHRPSCRATASQRAAYSRCNGRRPRARKDQRLFEHCRGHNLTRSRPAFSFRSGDPIVIRPRIDSIGTAAPPAVPSSNAPVDSPSTGAVCVAGRNQRKIALEHPDS